MSEQPTKITITDPDTRERGSFTLKTYFHSNSDLMEKYFWAEHIMNIMCHATIETTSFVVEIEHIEIFQTMTKDPMCIIEIDINDRIINLSGKPLAARGSIMDRGLHNSRLKETAFWLTDVDEDEIMKFARAAAEVAIVTTTLK